MADNLFVDPNTAANNFKDMGQSFTSGVDHAQTWAIQKAQNDIGMFHAQNQLQQIKQQKDDFEAKLGQQRLQEFSQYGAMENGPAKNALLKQWQKNASSTSYPIDDVMVEGAKDPSLKLDMANLQKVMSEAPGVVPDDMVNKAYQGALPMMGSGKIMEMMQGVRQLNEAVVSRKAQAEIMMPKQENAALSGTIKQFNPAYQKAQDAVNSADTFLEKVQAAKDNPALSNEIAPEVMRLGGKGTVSVRLADKYGPNSSIAANVMRSIDKAMTGEKLLPNDFDNYQQIGSLMKAGAQRDADRVLDLHSKQLQSLSAGITGKYADADAAKKALVGSYQPAPATQTAQAQAPQSAANPIQQPTSQTNDQVVKLQSYASALKSIKDPNKKAAALSKIQELYPDKAQRNAVGIP